MRKSLGVAFVALALCVTLHAQGRYIPYKVMFQPTITHKAGFATVKAASAQPLADAIQAVAQEYRWLVDFEDPPYAGTDLAIYRGLRRGARTYVVVAGGPFQCTYPVTPHLRTSRTAERAVLQKIVSDYNKSGKPGQFKVLSLPDGNFDVVGVATRNNAGKLVPVKPLLDTLITLPKKPRTARATLQAIAKALRVKMSIFLGLSGIEGSAPFHNAQPPSSVVGGANVPARDLLVDVADREGGKTADVFVLNYLPPGQTVDSGSRWFVSVGPAYRAEYDSFGRRSLVPVLKGRR